MGKPVPPQGQPSDAADDRLRAEIVSLQREIGAGVGGDFDPVTREQGARAR